MRNSIAVLAMIAAGAACTRVQSNGGSGASMATVADTIVGAITEAGSDPATWISLRPSAGGPAVRVSGDQVTTLRAATGTEVWASGARLGSEFRVDLFEVRMANGVAVDDGTVSVEQGKAWLTTRAGVRREIPNAPPQLLSMSGARVWVTRPAASQAPTFGVIRRP